MPDIVVRRLMPFTALKLSVEKSNLVIFIPVVRRLMPFTALKRLTANSPLFSRDGCAPPNAVYGIETLQGDDHQ